MAGFAHAIAGGGGNMVVKTFQSPNFVTGVQGWQVTITGDAEFNNLTIRGQFFGTDFIMNSAGIFFYTGTPAAGNLALSIAPAAGSDAFGNDYPQGFSLTESSSAGGTQIGLSTGAANQHQPAALQPYIANHGAGNELYFAQIRGPVHTAQQDQVQISATSSAADVSSGAQGFLAYMDTGGGNNTVSVWGYFGIALYVVSQLTAVAPGTGTSAANPAQLETWHTLSLASGWTQNASNPVRYRLNPDNTVTFTGQATHAAFSTTTTLSASARSWPPTGSTTAQDAHHRSSTASAARKGSTSLPPG